MKKLTGQFILVAGSLFVFACLLYNFLENVGPLTGVGFVTAFAIIGSVGLKADDMAAILAAAKRWHGDMTARFANIDGLTNLLKSKLDAWDVPTNMMTFLNTNRNRLQILIPFCNTTASSTNDRIDRDSLFKSTIEYCLHDVKFWAFGLLHAGVITLDDFHKMGFLVPGETAGHHTRAEATDAKAEVKVRILGPDQIEVVVDQAAEENAAKVKHGKPRGVNYIQVVVYTTDTGEEIHDEKSTHLRKKVNIPAQYHGKQLGIKAAFLMHVEDKPNFGDGALFSMPLTTQDLIAAFEEQHRIDMEARSKAVEIHKQEIAQVEEELKAQQEFRKINPYGRVSNPPVQIQSMKTMKQPYKSPDVFRRRVFLEDGIAAKASILLSGTGSIKQTDWADATEEIAGAGTDTQGDLWFVY
jgi:hypothetical protein